jgi:NTP pyrophosphatase (non-canonical NTP hydrolase)
MSENEHICEHHRVRTSCLMCIKEMNESLRVQLQLKGKHSPNEYIGLAVRTEAPIENAIKALSRPMVIRLNHAAKGMCSEAGEFNDHLKAHIYYGKDLDLVNLAEEIGDMMWYIALACDAANLDLQDIMEKNIAKLRARYPDRFTTKDALNRNLEKEREILEGKEQS